MTFKPKINHKKNDPNVERNTTGDICADLYITGCQKKAERVELTKEEKEFLAAQDECVFKPKINKSMKETKPVKIYGMEAYTKRMQKAIEEAEFKRAMTERSNFTASSGVKKAKTLVKSLSKQVLLPTPTFNMDKKHKFSSHFGDTDGMKIVK